MIPPRVFAMVAYVRLGAPHWYTSRRPGGLPAESLRTLDHHSSKGRNLMCSPATCRACGKASYSGCGQHVDQVLAGVPQQQRCACARPVRSPADPCCHGCSGAEQACWPIRFDVASHRPIRQSPARDSVRAAASRRQVWTYPVTGSYMRPDRPGCPDSGQNGTPERCARRTAVAHWASQPGRSPSGGLPRAGRRHPAPGWQEWSRAGGNVDHVWHVLQRWADWVYTVGTRASCGRASGQRPGQCRSSTDSNVTVSRHTRYGGRAVRAVIDIPIVHHEAAQTEHRARSESSFERAVQDNASRAETPDRNLIAFHDVFMIAVVRHSPPDR